MDHFAILGIAAVLAVIVAGFVFGARAAAKRRAALAALARQWGCSFSPGVDRGLSRHWPRLAPLERGDDRWWEDTISGPQDFGALRLHVQMGDFVWEDRSTDRDGKTTTSTSHASYLLVRLPVATPGLELRGEHVFDKFAAFFGFADLEFESAEFNRRFHVAATDKRFASDLVHPRMMEFLLAAPEYDLLIADGALLVMHSGTWEPEEFVAARGFVAGLLERWPPFLWDRLREAAAAAARE
jgi:hypothetical protein